jgi:hypothetical protein
VHCSARNHDERSRLNVVAKPIDFNFKMAVEADERFLPAVMHVKRGLIALARIESPIS